MRAALYDRYGPPEVLYVGTVPVPEPRSGQLLVKVRAATVNGGELAGRSGKVRLVTGRRFPLRTGIDFVGEVVEAGPDGAGHRVGETVWGVLPRSFGTAAEYIAVSPRHLAAAPTTLGPHEAASLLTGGLTGMTALRTKARLRPGERLLVRGASGGVGSVAVQLGKLLGAHVTALASGPGLDFATGLGADVVHDYRTTTPADLDRFDVIMDTVGTRHRGFRRLLAPGGRMVSVTFDPGHPVASLGYLAASALHGSRRVRFFAGAPDYRILPELSALADAGRLRPVVDTIHPLEEIQRAHRALEAGGVRGKHVIALA